MTREELLQHIDAGRAELEAVLAQIPAERMTDPALPNGWSVKDLVAHLAAWEQRAGDLSHILAAGREVEDGVSDFNEFNARVYIENRERSLEDVLRTEPEAFLRLRNVAEKFSETDLFDPARFAFLDGMPLMQLIANNSYGHYEEHMGDLRAWIQSL
jgi:uncharacterized protein (TIGR03083 family)